MKRLVCLLPAFLLGLASAASGQTLFQLAEPGAKALAEPVSPAAVEQQGIAVDFSVLRTKAGTIELPLLDGATYEVRRIGLEQRGLDDYTWRGKLQRPDGEKGDVVLSVTAGAMSGLIYAPDAVYEIVSRPGGHVLAKLDPARFPECAGEAHAEHAEEIPASDGFPTVPADSEGQIDVLVVYTAAARTAAGGAAGIQATIQNAVAAANTSYLNSQITTRLRLVHSAQVAYNEAGAAFSSHLTWVRNDGGVGTLRNTYGADLVAMLVDDGEACGIGYLLGGAHSVTNVACAVGNLSFAHELGHNMGCTHNPEDGSGGAFPYSYGHWVAAGGFRTVMSYATPCPGCIRVPQFSNPGILYLGFATGVTDQRDNARTINATDQQVANYRQSISAASTFADVGTGHWAFPYVEALYDAGITGGCATNPLRFCPDSPVSRDQMAVFLELAMRGSAFVPAAATGVFADVGTGTGMPAFIEQLYRDGITGGCATGPLRYCPSSLVTREQMAIFLLLGEHGASYVPPAATGLFADVPVSSPTARWIEQLYREGITGGCSTAPLRYCPGSTVTRAQMAVFLVTAFDLPIQ